MCTSIFLETKDKKHILSRTMDFSFPLDPDPVFLPRNYKWTSAVGKTEFSGPLGFLGAGRNLGESYFVADGVNEKGLSIAELYLPGDALYQDAPIEGKVNVAPHEFILWVLGNFGTIAELEKEVNKVNLVNAPAPLLNIVTPLHWIITDETGRCVVIEPTTATLSIKENPVGVMTNTPQLEWHIQNLRNYLNVNPAQCPPAKFGSFEATPFSQGTGTSGLPGGYTPPERFVRAAFFKEHTNQAVNEIDGVSNAYHILATVRIPKGVVVTPEKQEDYSLYVGSMCNESRTYYYNGYDNNQIAKATITDELLEKTEPVIFTVDREQTIKDLQAN